MESIQLKEKEAATAAEAGKAGVPYVALRGLAVSPEALSILPEEEARSMNAVVFFWSGPEVRLAAINPGDAALQDAAFGIGERLKAHVVVYRVSEDSLAYGLGLYATLPKITAMVKGVRLTQEEIERYQASMHAVGDIARLLTSSRITDTIAILVAAALQFDSSDIHVEAEEDGIKVRFRLDGVLEDIATLPKDAWRKMIARLKLISGLKINITDRPQDGRYTIFLNEGDTDVRVSTLPTNWGESVVMRILRPSSIRVEFEALGFRLKAFAKLEKEMQKPHGMILTTGPTGSGKTTTLYAMLQKLNTKDVKVITLEDPIEYHLAGINQSQVEAAKNYTFASGLRSILRQDPDIIMVGEIRDLETADVAVNAALTGHLLLSTVHTNDAAGAVPRLLNMGVKGFLLSQALNIVLGQRLVRKLCPACKKPATLSEEDTHMVKEQIETIPEASGERVDTGKAMAFFTAVGCDKCHGGYKGRLGIYEVLLVDSLVAEKMRGGSISTEDMRIIAAAQGMVTMFQDGILKAIDGLTSIDEIRRVASV
jgi:type II secretory ATPase GspE/PulE/Tfp pilus assembly ATPase PilB-like protein